MSRYYLDASVLLRSVLEQPGRLDFAVYETAIASELLVAECYRTLDRLRLREPGADNGESLRRDMAGALERVWLLPLNRIILEQVRQPMPASLGTLDAIHLCTAQTYRQAMSGSAADLIFATHDEALARAARLYGFAVAGA